MQQQTVNEFEPRILSTSDAPSPNPSNSTPLKTQHTDYSRIISIIKTWTEILNARLLALLGMIGALFIFGYAMYDPTNLRLIASSLYAVGVLWPIIWLYLHKG